MAAAGDVDNDGRVDFFLTTVYAGRPERDCTATSATGSSSTSTKRVGRDHREDLPGRLRRHQTATATSTSSPAGRCGSTRRQATATAKHNYLKVRLEGGGKCNRAAVGSRVIVKVGGKTFTRQVEAGTGSGCQNDLTLHFGVGEAKGPADVTVHWAGGGASTQQAELNRIVVLRK